MEIETIIAMTPEEFADAWHNDREDVIHAVAYAALGIVKTQSDPDTLPE